MDNGEAKQVVYEYETTVGRRWIKFIHTWVFVSSGDLFSVFDYII